MNGSAVQEVFRTPAMAAAAVTRARQDDQDVALLHSLATTTADPDAWHNLRNAGVVALFLDIILRMPDRTVPPSPTASPMPLWALPLQGLFNAMVGIQRTPDGFQVPENRDAAVKIFKETPAICRRIYDDKARLCGSETHSEDLRRCVTQWIQATWNGAPMLGLRDVQNEIKASNVIELATCCWVFATSTELRARAAAALPELLSQPEPTKTELDQIIATAGSYDKLVGASTLALQSPEAIDDILIGNMSVLIVLTGQTSHVELLRQYANGKTHYHVMTALRRQLSLPDASEELWKVLEYAGMLLVNIVNEASSPTDELTNLIIQKSAIPLLGGVLIRCAQASKQSPPWSSFLTLLKHTYTCKSPTCRIRTSPAYVTALRTHLAWRWSPTLRRLHAAPELQKEWLLLGHGAGLADTTERQAHEGLPRDVGGCWWVECTRDVDADSEPPRKCSRCKRAQYCTTECQNKDWKGHKKLCTVSGKA